MQRESVINSKREEREERELLRSREKRNKPKNVSESKPTAKKEKKENSNQNINGQRMSTSLLNQGMMDSSAHLSSFDYYHLNYPANQIPMFGQRLYSTSAPPESQIYSPGQNQSRMPQTGQMPQMPQMPQMSQMSQMSQISQMPLIPQPFPRTQSPFSSPNQRVPEEARQQQQPRPRPDSRKKDPPKKK